MVTAASFTRRLVLAGLVALGTTGSAAAALDSATAVRLKAPARVVQGASATLTATVASGSRCSLAIRYRSGTQRVGAATSSGGRATFTFKIPQRAAPGRAKAVVSCGRAGSASASLIVIGSVIPPKINVAKSGFSVRVQRQTTTVSWGAILANESPRQDALRVVVLVNFVMPDNTLIGTATRSISRIVAGTSHAVGGDLTFLGNPAISRLEFVVQVRDQAAPQRVVPAIANPHVVPDLTSPAYVGAVQGEVVNDKLDRSLMRAELSTVALDAAGNVLGGGFGYASASLPPTAREFFKINGLRGVQVANVASVMVSVVPTYEK